MTEHNDLLTDPRWARVAWTCVAEPKAPFAARAIEGMGPVDSMAALRAGTWARTGDYAARLAELDVAAVRRALATLRVRVVIPDDDEWPSGLDVLEHPPYALYVRGSTPLDELMSSAVAIVGARGATGYGQHVARTMAAELADSGVCIVSGAAYGIDACAHGGALSVGRPTVAVLARGLDRAYPSRHAPLLTQIAADGAVVSELPPGWAPQAHRFLSRNRLIATMTRGTVVVEAALRSGSLSTAKWALDHGRYVAMVPGPVTSITSAGCHEWIRAKDAALVTDARDVLDLVKPLGASVSDLRRAPERALDTLTPVQRQVQAAVPVRAGADVAALTRITGLGPVELLSTLGQLEAGGFLERRGLLWCRTRHAARQGA